MIDLIKNNLSELTRICLSRGVKKLSVFGSAVSDQYNSPRSDIDFLVEFFPQPPIMHADNYFGLLEDFEDLFGVEIDLVETSTLRNPFFMESVYETLIEVYNAA